MIRKATFNDIDLIEDTYNEHFKYEIKHGAFTVFKKGIYPTRKDAEKAIDVGTLYVYEENSSCKALRLDTGSQNIPALSLYKKLGFQVVATASMNVGSAIEHSGHLFLEKLL